VTPSKAKKLLDAMRRSANNWSRDDLVTLYLGYGFHIRRGEKHDIAVHSKYKHLRTTLPNHASFAKEYVRCAVGLVDEAVRLEAKEKQK